MFAALELEGDGVLNTDAHDEDARRNVLSQMLSVTELTPLVQVEDGLFVKDETSNPSGCFKLRSMLRTLLQLPANSAGAVTVSCGNTGLALGLAASLTGVPAHVWMTDGSSPHRMRRIRATGADIHEHGTDISQAAAAAKRFAANIDAEFISPGQPGQFVDGHRAIFSEIIKELPTVKSIFVPTGGGGLLSAGTRVIAEHPDQKPRLVGVQPLASHPVADLFDGHPERPTPPHVSYAECLEGDLEPGAAILDAISLVDHMTLVSRSDLRAARTMVRAETGLQPELGAVAGVAAALREAPFRQGGTVAILTGSIGAKLTPTSRSAPDRLRCRVA